MNILVTGGAGGIGSTLCFLLNKNGHKTIAYDNLNNGYFENLIEDGKQVCNFIYGDIRNTETLIKIINDKNIEDADICDEIQNVTNMSQFYYPLEFYDYFDYYDTTYDTYTSLKYTMVTVKELTKTLLDICKTI